MNQKYNKFLKLFNALDEKLRTSALTHSSFANDHAIMSNERLEYLGDSVLDLIVAEYLYKNSTDNEGKLSKMRSVLVCEDNLACIARDIEIEKSMFFGKSLQNIKISNSILADVIESILGAMFLQFGFGSIKSAVYAMLSIKEFLNNGGKSEDYKTLLQEYAQKNKLVITYVAERKKGDAGQFDFFAKCFINKKLIGRGRGSNKRIAEQNAARITYKKCTAV